MTTYVFRDKISVWTTVFGRGLACLVMLTVSLKVLSGEDNITSMHIAAKSLRAKEVRAKISIKERKRLAALHRDRMREIISFAGKKEMKTISTPELVLVAECHEELHEFRKAVEICRHIIERNPDELSAYFLLIRGLVNTDELAAAEKTFLDSQDRFTVESDFGSFYAIFAQSHARAGRTDIAIERIDAFVAHKIQLGKMLPQLFHSFGVFLDIQQNMHHGRENREKLRSKQQHYLGLLDQMLQAIENQAEVTTKKTAILHGQCELASRVSPDTVPAKLNLWWTILSELVEKHGFSRTAIGEMSLAFRDLPLYAHCSAASEMPITQIQAVAALADASKNPAISGKLAQGVHAHLGLIRDIDSLRQLIGKKLPVYFDTSFKQKDPMGVRTVAIWNRNSPTALKSLYRLTYKGNIPPNSTAYISVTGKNGDSGTPLAEKSGANSPSEYAKMVKTLGFTAVHVVADESVLPIHLRPTAIPKILFVDSKGRLEYASLLASPSVVKRVRYLVAEYREDSQLFTKQTRD